MRFGEVSLVSGSDKWFESNQVVGQQNYDFWTISYR